jgi:hypothetical protein
VTDRNNFISPFCTKHLYMFVTYFYTKFHFNSRNALVFPRTLNLDVNLFRLASCLFLIVGLRVKCKWEHKVKGDVKGPPLTDV